jgi:hypothetical protein
LPTFRDNLSIPSSMVKKSKIRPFISWPLRMGRIGCPETSIRDHPYTLRNVSEERRSQIAVVLFAHIGPQSNYTDGSNPSQNSP